jgi:hypothetical protein
MSKEKNKVRHYQWNSHKDYENHIKIHVHCNDSIIHDV